MADPRGQGLGREIAGYQPTRHARGPVTIADEAYSAQPGTSAWARFGTAGSTS